MGVENLCGNEKIVALVLSGLCGVADFGLKNVLSSFFRIVLNVDLCARVGCFKPQRKQQFVSRPNERRQEIREQDASAISKNTLSLGTSLICLNDLPLAHVR